MDKRVFLVIIVVLSFVCSGLHAAYISRRDTYAMEKYMKVMTVWTYMAAAILYILALYYFDKDETYVQQAILALVMLVCLPAALVSVSVAFIVGGNV